MDIFVIDKEIKSLVNQHYLGENREFSFKQIIDKLAVFKESLNKTLLHVQDEEHYDKYLNIAFHWNTFMTFHGYEPLFKKFPNPEVALLNKKVHDFVKAESIYIDQKTVFPSAQQKLRIRSNLNEQTPLSVQTESIFPVIKKFLNIDHDIFIRELVSNAVNASQKLKTLSSKGEINGDLGDVRIEVELDANKKTLSIIDRGVGMMQEELDKYLNQVAFSRANIFLEKYKSQQENDIISHFGLGFYSSFMVSDWVEVYTKSHYDEPATYWSCDGSGKYEIYPIEKPDRGTKIVLHINDDSMEFLDVDCVKGTLNKFCRFLPVPIFFTEIGKEKEQHKNEATETIEAEKPINNINPAWTREPGDLTPEDYENFYRELYPYSAPPLFWIYLKVDHPLKLTGILYFARIKQNFEIQKDKIQLYSNQLFVTDEVKDIVAEFLMLLNGVIDSPDIPLNVSRTYLQGDPSVKKINSHITKKVAEKLEEMFKNYRKAFEDEWESLGVFVKYGAMTQDKFLEKADKFLVLEEASLEGESKNFYTLDEYRIKTEGLQKNRDGKLVILYTTDSVQQDAYIQAAKRKGYKVVKLETFIDGGFINDIEMKWEKVQFTRVDADIVDHLIDKGEAQASVLEKDDEQKLKMLFGFQIPEVHATIEVKGLSESAPPVIATRPEFMRRMKEMSTRGGGMASWYANMPDEVTLTVNSNHTIYKIILKEEDTQMQEKQVRNLADLALLSQGLLRGNELTNFINRSVELLQGEMKSNIAFQVRS